MSLVLAHFYQFGEFTVDCNQRILLRDGNPFPLTPKVFDTLPVLVENKARIVTKEELMNRIWPESFVVEANLTFSIRRVRKSLGENVRRPLYIKRWHAAVIALLQRLMKPLATTVYLQPGFLRATGQWPIKR